MEGGAVPKNFKEKPSVQYRGVINTARLSIQVENMEATGLAKAEEGHASAHLGPTDLQTPPNLSGGPPYFAHFFLFRA